MLFIGALLATLVSTECGFRFMGTCWSELCEWPTGCGDRMDLAVRCSLCFYCILYDESLIGKDGLIKNEPFQIDFSINY